MFLLGFIAGLIVGIALAMLIDNMPDELSND